MNFTPSGNKILAKRLSDAEKTEGGIIITPDKEFEKIEKAVIIATGKGLKTKSGKLKPLTVKVGDEILFENRMCLPVTLEGQEYLMMRETDIIGLLS